MPLFHAAGLYVTVTTTLFWDTPVGLSVPGRPLSSDLVLECLENFKADGMILPPILLEELSQSKESMDVLASLNMVAFGGGESDLNPYLFLQLTTFQETSPGMWETSS